MGKNKFDPKNYTAESVYRKRQHERQKLLSSILELEFSSSFKEIERLSEKYGVKKYEIYEIMGQILLFKFR